ncbi:MAG: hypothetical protein WD898_00700, partial [Candidatus Paceibacterota bacterium]
EKAGSCQKMAKRLRVDADKLETELAEAQKAIIAEEANAEPLKVTTSASIEDEDGQESPTSLKERGLEVKVIPAETPESLEAEAAELDAKETEAVAAKNYSGAQSFATKAKNKRERADHLRAEAERKQAAESEQPKLAEVQPNGHANGVAKEHEEVAAPATEGQATSGNEELKALARRFAKGEIDAADYKEMKALLS